MWYSVQNNLIKAKNKMNSLQTITELTYSSIKMFMMRKLIEISLARIIDSEQTV